MGRILRVLQVEDSPDDAELVRRELVCAGYEVDALCVTASTPMVNALRDRDWDIVLSDYRLPGFGGMEALRILQASGVDIPFIVVSGAIREEIAVAAMKAGAHDYVFKGNLARLCPAIERELKEASVRQQRRAADQAMRESELRYRALFEYSSIPIWVEDFSGAKALFDQYRRQGVEDFHRFFAEHPEEARACAAAIRILDANEPSAELLGYRRKEDIPDFLPCFFIEETWPPFQEKLAILAEGGTAFSCEIPVRTVDGTRKVLAFQISVSPGCEKSLERVLASFFDITERKQLETVLQDMEKLSAKAQMAAYIAHEINNPLAGIKNAFTLIERSLPDDHPRRWYADLIRREIDRIAGIIRTMYHVYRPPASSVRDVPLLEAFQDIESLLVPMCRAADVSIEVEPLDRGFTVCMNEGLLRQVLFNLVQNAVGASPAGGTVRLKAEREAGGARIVVQDEGHGIPGELREKVFQAGFTTRRESEMSGLGLGLAACRHFVESFKGTLDFEPNESGKGVRFVIHLPDA